MSREPAKIAAAIGFGLAFIGSFLPWASIGALDIAGTHGDGVITLGLALAGAAIILLSTSQGWSLLAVAGAVAVSGIGIYDAANIQDKATSVNQTQSILQLHAAVGTGLYLVILGGLAAGAASLVSAGSFAAKAPALSTPMSQRNAAVTLTAKCSECGAPIAVNATRCPSCGVVFEGPPEQLPTR